MTLKLKNIDILVVEDLAPMRQLISELLKSMGAGRVYGAKDGEEAYRLYTKMQPDVIFTDWEMPLHDGLAFIKKIRRDKTSHNRSIPIIMITGYNSAERIAKARDNGITEFLTKPFTAEDIAKRLHHVIKNPRDIIVLPDFIGPDRRRKESSPDGEDTRKEETDKKIKANPILQKKAGIDPIDKNAIDESQAVIDDNQVDFKPIALRLIHEFETVIKQVKNIPEPPSRMLSDLISPIMQLKANAKIFKYDLVGNLAMIILNFLEKINEINPHVLEILDTQTNTLKLIFQNDLKGTGGEIGQKLEKETSAACNRYMHVRAKILENKLKQKTK